ncbi:MAG: hypothetical protein HOJ15_04370 [Candidatus Jacksonbacteria bacterium]|jgi:glycerol uptake facilitator-like aquaporin|nr:hypothetical protein [Candidatus Jacksonbacteria bacterium]MBT6034239.1 hypothetical protein [Candidatus Jacksonbacteria bacterium]MBT6301634.1 hypothetical protein [Candidatus Jacksonbacteria bacterium]MBT6756888.1 hypothetical protein [Candidatus Jacksonbacteria bacterium]MBT7008215.1 hypothetical protein [Candidatus Jacksonbacteria bacterium]
MKKYIAELIGTFALAFAIVLSLGLGLRIATPLVAGLVLGLFVYTIGPISGAHLNPAVTIAAFSLKRLNPKDTVGYLIAQFAGAGLALAIGKAFLLAPLAMQVESTSIVGLAEVMGAFFLAFGIAAVMHKKVSDQAAGLVVGGSLLLGAMISGTVANGLINPAVAVAVGSVNMYYILGPIVGAIIGMWVYRALAK